jgi:putative transposase
MTRLPDCTLSPDLLDLIADQGLEALPELMRSLINQAMLSECHQHLQAAPYERSASRQGYATGYKPKTVTTRVGPITFDVPQVRDGSFYPTALEKGLRSERAFTLAVAEMYVQGVSTRKVAAITEQLCGVEVSSSQVSRAAAQFDQVLEGWGTRPLGQCRYPYLDARYEDPYRWASPRCGGLDCAGCDRRGQTDAARRVGLVERQEVQWRSFLQSLVSRGLRGVQPIISDAHAGL